MRYLSVLVLLAALPAWGQTSQFTLGPDGQWVAGQAPEPGSDGAILADARRLLAEGEPGKALDLLKPWLKEHAHTDNALLPAMYLARGDAYVADGDEYEALYDYEYLCRQYPGTPEFITAVERELEIATRYVNGLNRKRFGLRIASATSEGVELLIRVQERTPGSGLAERALLELADYYYRKRDYPMSVESYDIFLKNYPRSRYRMQAMLRLVRSYIANYKGARYDNSGLQEARALTQDFMVSYPLDARRAKLDDSLVSRIDEAAAAQMLVRAHAYDRRRDPVSSRATLRRLIEKYPATAGAERAAGIMKDRGWEMPASSAQPAGPPAVPQPSQPDPGAGP
ncbi:MAG: outer membrane protein assembly factor BamD [Phycisphaerales bacterium]|nr:outer membrane protein assembly factor BamD [Phycisphaerales bacterium]